MLRNNYSELLKKNFGRERVFRGRGKISAESNLVVNDSRSLSAIFRLECLEVGKEGRTLLLEQLQHRNGAAADLELRALARAKLQHRSPGSRVGGHHDFRLGGVGKNSPRRLARHLPAVDLVGHPAITLHQVLDESNVAFLRFVDLGPPLLLECLVSDNGRRNNE